MPLLDTYDRLVIFDTETTGLRFARDEIIEFAAVALEKSGIVRQYDELITLSPGNRVPPNIEALTHITNEDIAARGVPKREVTQAMGELFAGNTLLLAYNAHFDLSFLFYMLLRHGDAGILKGKDKVDLLTVYKDRRPYPHKLANAIESYGLTGQVQNSHRAIDDVLATVAVLNAMEQEKDDLLRYVNLFGYNAKYGLGSKPISSVTYRAQSYDPVAPLYELL